MIYGIIPAAGYSRRMGSWKPLLPLGHRPAVAWAAEAVLGAADLAIVVTGFRGDELPGILLDHLSPGDHERILFTPNPDYDAGMFSSIQAGVRHLPPSAPRLTAIRESGATRADLCAAAAPEAASPDGTGCFFILHADMPLIRTAHITVLLEQFFGQRKADILQPRYRNTPGHPVICRLEVKDTILQEDCRSRMTEVFRKHRVLEFTVDDPAYTADMDTPEEYRRLIDGR